MIRKFSVTMWVEGEGSPEDDDKITKIVESEDSPLEALSAAIAKLKSENPSINHMKVWSWSVRRLHE